MLASELPFEILAQIGAFLSKTEVSRCAIQCRVWNNPFQECLWKDVMVYDKHRLDLICDAVEEENIYRKNGSLVRKLALSEKFTLTDEQLHTIQRFFPELRYLFIGRTCLTDITYSTMDGWNHWRFLTELVIEVDTLLMENKEKTVLKILFHLPHLESLDISQPMRDPAMMFTIKDLEILHTYLPRLMCFRLYLNLCNLSDEDLVHVETVRPAENVKIFGLYIKSMDYRWLCYFARKYSNVHTLEWESYKDREANEYQNEAIESFSTIPLAFPHLRTVTIDSKGHRQQKHLVLWELLSLFKARLKHIGITLSFPPENLELLKDVLDKSISLSRMSLETLSIQSVVPFARTQDITSTFNHCPHLVHLQIITQKCMVVLDTILDRCLALRSLTITGTLIMLKKSASNKIITHNLRKIDISQVKVKATMFVYLSSRCRKLDSMRLTDVRLKEELGQNPKDVCINMPFTHFQTLYLHRVIGHVPPVLSIEYTIDMYVATIPTIVVQPDLNVKKRSTYGYVSNLNILKNTLSTHERTIHFARRDPWTRINIIAKIQEPKEPQVESASLANPNI
ncbi:hypothetical protein CLU79DRAFT_747254 [Phycomyces nitens]|nr:hypothetical protein CLU79DRAFT_747254 [Phycomyces nitens]